MCVWMHASEGMDECGMVGGCRVVSVRCVCVCVCCVCVCVCVHMYMYTRTCKYIHIYICKNMYIFIYMYMLIRMHLSDNVSCPLMLVRMHLSFRKRFKTLPRLYRSICNSVALIVSSVVIRSLQTCCSIVGYLFSLSAPIVQVCGRARLF